MVRMPTGDRNRGFIVSMDYLPIWGKKYVNLVRVRDASE